MIISKDSSAKTVRTVRDSEVLTPAVQTTTASFVDLVGSLIDAACAASVAMTIANTGGANGLSWQVLASIDGITFVVVKTSANVAFGASDVYTVSPAPYRYYKTQVKDQVGASHTTAVVSVIAK